VIIAGTYACFRCSAALVIAASPVLPGFQIKASFILSNKGPWAIRLGGQLSNELGLAYAETRPGERVEGIYRRYVDLASGRFAVIEQSRDFTLVP
jgi:hypothetical protein